MNYSYQILMKTNETVVVQMNEELLKLIQQEFPLVTLNIKPKEVSLSEKRMHNFQRRIVPFFMNQFMHWADEMGYKQVDGYLRTIHKKKTSKQQKFELGDLKKLFGAINPRTKLIQAETQLKWREFLSTQAELRVILNNKIKDEETKSLYIEAIQSLKEELKKAQPYDKFLSLVKKDYVTIQESSIQENSSLSTGMEMLGDDIFEGDKQDDTFEYSNFFIHQ